jgi:hypothetical protein
LQYQTLLDLLHEKLIDCKIDKTSVTESGLTVNLERLRDEIIPFFHTDSPQARKILSMPDDNQKSCDYFVVYTKASNNAKEIACFLELKGKNFEQAVKQVCNTYKHIKILLEQYLEKAHHQKVIYSVSICMHGRAPSPKAALQGREQLKNIFCVTDQHIEIRHGCRKHNLGNFIRRLYIS